MLQRCTYIYNKQFICSDQAFLYPDLYAADGFFNYDDSDLEYFIPSCNHYEGYPLEVCIRQEDASDEEYYITCLDDYTLKYYAYTNNKCNKDTSNPDEYSDYSYEIDLREVDGDINAFCNYTTNCEYMLVNYYRSNKLPGFCEGSYETDSAYLINVCFDFGNYSATYECDGTIVTGYAYDNNDCSNSPFTTVTKDIYEHFIERMDLYECYEVM